MIVRLVSAVSGGALIVPALIIALALGPVILGILCAVGCAMLVMTVGNLLIGFGLTGRWAGRTGARFVRR